MQPGFSLGGQALQRNQTCRDLVTDRCGDVNGTHPVSARVARNGGEGEPVVDTGDPREEDLAEKTRLQNSNLRRLIDAVGTLLAGSRELLKHLQPLGEGEPPSDKAHRQDDIPSPPQPCPLAGHNPEKN